MDKEFHYHLTYLTAARAGFPFEDALTIARSCQAVDENTHILDIDPGTPHHYANYVSQTMNLLKPRYSRMRIYPVFHFIPGEPDSPPASRADGRTHPLNTTPDSPLANQCFDAAAATGDLMQIGIASHAYADTWSHQNFVGYWDAFNDLEGFVNHLIPSIGHADAKTNPDRPAHIWTDPRLMPGSRTISNNERFLSAAGRLYDKFCSVLDKAPVPAERDAMLSDFSTAFGPARENPWNTGRQGRIRQYGLLAQRPEYNGRKLPDFSLAQWQTEVIVEKEVLNYDLPNEIRLEWRSPANYKNSKWFRFQEAVKAYQRMVLDIYNETVYSGLAAELRKKIMMFS